MVFLIVRNSIYSVKTEKSRRDAILLTVGETYGRNSPPSFKSRRDGTSKQ